MAVLLNGSVTMGAYALLMRNLLPVYQALEYGLDQHLSSPAVGPEIARPELRRSSALEADLGRIAGIDWADKLPQLATGQAYAGRIAEAASGDGSRLLAHAYVRYLGDLSGGQILRRLLIKSLGLSAECLNFYDFPEIADIRQFKTAYRDALDRAPVGDGAAVEEEAAEAFRLNIALSEEIGHLDHSNAAAGEPPNRSP